MDQTLINLLLALATNELIHNIIEANSVRQKVARLSAYINKKPYQEMKVKVDTRAKAYGIATVAFVVVTGILFGIFSLINLQGNTALWYGIVVLVLAYFVSGILLDKFHVEIERVTRPFMKK